MSDIVPGICWSHPLRLGVTAITRDKLLPLPSTFSLVIPSARDIFPGFSISFFICCDHLGLLHLSQLLSSDAYPPPLYQAGWVSPIC